MNRNKTMDLTTGSIFKQLMIFALPLLAGQLFQTLYNSVDSVVIGRFESAQALAAVTASSSISMIVSGFFNGMSAGASAVFSRYFGAKDNKSLHDSIHTTVLFSIFFGAFLSILGILLTPALLKVTTCPQEIWEMAVQYLRIYLIGIFFTCMYNVAAAVLRSIGDSQSPFIFLVISSVLNIILDILFVAVIPMGVVGVALATIIAQGVSMVLAFWKMMKLDDEYRFRFSHMMIKWNYLGEVAKLGLPAGIQSSLTAIGALIVQTYTNSFSEVAIAGIGSAMRIDQFAGMLCNALGLAMTTFIGQNLGAGKNDRAHKAVGVSTIVALVYVIIVSIPMYIFAPQLVSIFSLDAEVIEYGTGFLRVIMPVYTMMALNQLYGGILRGFRYSISAMVCVIVGYLAIRQGWLFVTLNFIEHNVQYLYWCYPVGWAGASIPMIFIYLVFIRRKFKSKKPVPMEEY